MVDIDEAIACMERFSGWMFPEEAKLLYKTAKESCRRSASAVVEIGSFCGRSTTILGKAVLASRREVTNIFAIDPHKGNLSIAKSKPTWDDFNRNMETAGLTNVVVPIREKSTEVQWSGPICFLLIDGLHDMASVRADYNHFFKFVEPGGCIAFHDYSNPDHPDVRRFVDERIRDGEISFYALPPRPSKEASLILTRKRASVSVIIPTCGRTRLQKSLDSIISAGIGRNDEVIVVGDGQQPVSRSIVSSFKPSFRIQYIETDQTPGAMGGPQRNAGMALAISSHLCFLDDDDEYMPGALSDVRAAAEESPGKLLIFREEGADPRHLWEMIWQTQEVKYGNVGSQGLVVPNIKPQLGVWGSSRGSDFQFLQSTLALWPGGEKSIVWMDRVIAYLY